MNDDAHLLLYPSIECGNEYPEQIYKHTQQRQTQTVGKGNVGFKNYSLQLEAAIERGKMSSSGTEAAAIKVGGRNPVNPVCVFFTYLQPTPGWLVSHELGEEWDKNGRSYNSIRTSYVQRSLPFSDILSRSTPLDLYVGLGIFINRDITTVRQFNTCSRYYR